MRTVRGPTCIMVHEEQMSQLMGHDRGLDVDVGVHAGDACAGFLAHLASVRYALHTGNQEDYVLGWPGNKKYALAKSF